MDTTQAQALFQAYASQYKALLDQLPEPPPQAIWSTGVLHEIEPLENNRAGFKNGKALKNPPAKTKGKCLQILDAHQALIYRKTGTELPNCFYEEFFIHEAGRITGLYFGASPSKELLHAKIRSVVDGKVTEASMCGKYGTRLETFRYDDQGLLVEVDVQAMQRDGQSGAHRVLIDWQGGEPVVTQHFPNGHINLIYP